MTLVEVLMVVFIAGLVAGFAVLTMPERESQADRAVRTLTETITQLNDRALLTGEVLAVRQNGNGLEVLQWTGYDWQPAGIGGIGVPEGGRIEILNETRKTLESARPDNPVLVLNPLGSGAAARFQLIGTNETRTLLMTPDGKVVETDAG